MNKDLTKKYFPYGVALLVFLSITLFYCLPYLQGEILQQSDTNSWTAMSQESREFTKATGENTWWTNSMFSGMPTFQITGYIPSILFINQIGDLLHLGLTSILGYIIGYFIGFFILLRAFGVNKWLAIVGAIAIAFSTYFFIIVEAGHNTKAATIGYMAPVIGGFFLIFRKKYYWGVPLVLLYTSIGSLQHVQMTYYFFMTIGIFTITELCIHLKEKKSKDFLISLLIFSCSIGIALGTRYGHIRINSEYLTETMRGGHSELSKGSNNETLSKSSGLSLEYATQWSYGIDETMTLLIPNFMGGSSSYNVGEKSGIYDDMIQKGVPKNDAVSYSKGLPMYWGTQPFTSGPVYIGAIICFLFVLGLYIVKGAYKWALLVATLFSIALSWGHNLMWLTEFFFNYFPMYSKFRAVSSILVVAEITMPLLGFLAIKTVMDKKTNKQKDKEGDKKEILKSIRNSAGITAGLCLLLALFGKTIFSFSSPSDAQLPEWITPMILAERASMLTSDAFRSFIFIILGAGILWLYTQERIKCKHFILGLGLLILADMVPVNLRFFNHDNFVPKQLNSSFFAIQPYEQAILRDKDPHFRVFNVSSNTFNDARTSYRLKSVGGYHAAKLRRYQDLIDAHISKNNMNVLNMLNTKYFILPGENRQPTPQLNPSAMGNAWFIDTLMLVNNPDEESEALRTLNMATTAVVDKKFGSQATVLTTAIDSTAKIILTKYAPNKLEYKSISSTDKSAVFSEIYYPYGWKAYIDGKPAEHFRVNYVLRALNIPAGEHDIRFEFVPDTLVQGEKIAVASLVLMFCVIGFCIGFPIYQNIKKNKSIKLK